MAATSDMAKAVDALRDMIAATAKWQSWTGLSEVLSKARVDITNIENADIGTLPRIRLGTGEGAGFENQSLATGQGSIVSGTIRMTFLESFSGSGAWETEEETFRNNFGTVISEINDLDDGLVNIKIDDDGPVTRPDQIDSADRQLIRASFLVRFGLEGVSS